LRELTPHGFKLRVIREHVIEYVRKCSEIIQHKEHREGWNDRSDYWYHVIIPTPVFPKGLFVEKVLRNSDPELPEVKFIIPAPSFQNRKKSQRG
jgi:hypothetical protein